MTTIEQIDQALGRYYASIEKFYFDGDGKGKFLAFCVENGMEDHDEETIDDELDPEDVDNCLYLEFDEHFPLPPEYEHKSAQEKKQFIFDLLEKCYKNPKITFGNNKNQKEKPRAKEKEKRTSKEEEKEKASYSSPYAEYIQKNQQIKLVCGALHRYYTSINKTYDRIFSLFCQDSGVSDADLLDELKQEPDDSLLIEFDDNFPFDAHLLSNLNIDERKKNIVIIELIKKCNENPYCTFGHKLPQCFFIQSKSTLEYLYKITSKEFNQIVQLYKNQCPCLWAAGMGEDKGFLYIMAIGRKYNFNYLQYLMDAFYADTINNIDASLTVKKWSIDHPHFKALKEIKFIAPWPKEKGKKNIPCDAYEVAIMAMNCFGKRCVPVFDFAKFIRIDDSLEILARYMQSAYGFISQLLHDSKSKKMPICPFQFDFCIGYGKPYEVERTEQIGDDDEDESDNEEDDEKEGKYVDIIGDIKQKLNTNKLKHVMKQLSPRHDADYEYMARRHFFRELYRTFVDKYGLDKDKGSEASPSIYLHRKRLIMFVDRRSKQGEEHDDVWIYEPPKNCRDIPKNAVPEWPINASKTCLLPNMEYGDGSNAIRKDLKQTGKNIKHSNIWSQFHCKGQVFTLSFTVNSLDDIQCCLYWHGQMVPFEPVHLKKISPHFINMKWNGANGQYSDDVNSKNGQFLNNVEAQNGIDSVIERMQNPEQN